ncbi:NAD(P)H-binding protein [Streptomyces durbertensis]|uniref:NAD(P)H-binding protein n=1 Tax=Streptomyces durbertensis TaxID=2448886 RepID=A0ABR6EPA2_9ACTN|nr:NAD(P)H-binding protein [Streptomyces durbertensis]MBB1247175.1 NAD(P)H-binding protein [Streptomyces durbertensis]
MHTVIAGGAGQIATRLARLLADRGDTAHGLIRDTGTLEKAATVRAAGAEPVVCDLETAGADEVAELLRGADAAVFAAGAGPGSGTARKETVDRAAAELFAEAAARAGVRRLLVVSAMRVDEEPPPGTDPVFAAYLRAKGAADTAVRARDDLDWTILRPGRLTNTPGTGRVHLADHTGRAEISRDDVAAVLLALLDEPATARRTLELVAGDTPIPEAVRALTH